MNIDKFKILAELQKDGISILHGNFTDDDLLSISNSIGRVIKGDRGELLQGLKAKEKGEGVPGTFTNIYGLDDFPWHTDTSYWNKPTRYLMLTSRMPSPCHTYYTLFETLFKGEDEFERLSNRAIYLLKHPSFIKVVNFKFKFNGLLGYRYDTHLMKPYNDEAKMLDKMIKCKLSERGYQSIDWDGKTVAIIDNWQGIHSRGSAKEDSTRELIRIYIDNYELG